MKNLSKAYYKDYFSDTLFRLRRGEIKADGKNIQDRNKHLLASANRKYLKAAQEIYLSSHLPVNHSFCLDVRYPGLVTGVGISHEAKVEGEFKLGLHLDYTTGLPVIYGSSVKGVLRSAFREENLLDILPILAPNLKNELEPIQRKMQSKPLKAWADAIFGDDDDRDSRSPYERDIFFDAIVVNTNSRDRFLAADSITPHGSDPLKNPVPLTFVRIASGCKIEFRFRLTDSDSLTANEKETLFKAILIAFGIGAKTNVGYGRLEYKD
ncbi:type III-B CRISPR module RAMP protein Cmr6 [Barnesiella viscericola]|uniref:type III-B CRISPR module RAMP protein Cmr6 n=1 Tax=Barnesiella viscericola TaxID=397865 RepID=UPI0025A45817|nr:type III-B CRISPR module RAMP protein Cmr6 [Barnesiella viscericola]MDM8269883.1 type III-B CRISPR module RAMP protein Cmr6 [Barnesiella viscericola]